MEILHHQMTGMHKIILVESGEEKMATLKTASRAETFKANILQAQEAYYSEKGTTDVDLDMPQRSRPSSEWVNAKMHSMYVEIVETAEKEREAEKKKQEEHDKQKLEDEKALFKNRPEVVLEELIDERIAAKGGEMDVDTDASKAKLVVDAIRENDVPKNEAGGAGKKAPWQWGKKWLSKGPASRQNEGKGSSWKGKGKGYSSTNGKAGKAKKGEKGGSQKGWRHGERKSGWKGY